MWYQLQAGFRFTFGKRSSQQRAILPTGAAQKFKLTQFDKIKIA